MCVCVCVCVGVCRLGIDMLMDNRKILISIEERRAQTASFLLSSRDRWPRHRPGGVLKKTTKKPGNRATPSMEGRRAGGLRYPPPPPSGQFVSRRRVSAPFGDHHQTLPNTDFGPPPSHWAGACFVMSFSCSPDAAQTTTRAQSISDLAGTISLQKLFRYLKSSARLLLCNSRETLKMNRHLKPRGTYARKIWFG